MSEEEEEEEEYDSRDIGGIWQVSSNRKAGKQTTRKLNVPKSKEWGSEYPEKWKPIDDVEESSAGALVQSIQRIMRRGRH